MLRIKRSTTLIRRRHTSLLTSDPGTPRLISIFSPRMERMKSQSGGALAGLKRAGMGRYPVYRDTDM